ncbi:MAG: hypothetical protein D4R84_16090 [Rhodocyclaceae bacterium]|nr:MAG: hypothetical protein D4R84_16090 [Rhodocyclaceae bacterium]
MDKKGLSELIRRCDSEFVIPLEEDFGNHEWLWFPGIPPAELEAWWGALEDVETFWLEKTRVAWPGEFVRAHEEIELSHLWEILWGKDTHRARIGLNEQFDLTEPDTYLRRPDGKILLHKGAYAVENLSSADD